VASAINVSYFDSIENVVKEYEFNKPPTQNICNWGTGRYINNFIFISDDTEHKEFMQSMNLQLPTH
jgi:hypothetical protein